MHARTFDRAALALALSAFTMGTAWAGGGHGGAGFHRVGGIPVGLRGIHGGSGGFHAGGAQFGGGRGLPPIAGVIHERQAGQPYVSAYGHTSTAVRFGGFPRGGVPGYGFGPASVRGDGYRQRHGIPGAYGHVATGLRFAARRGFVGGYGGYGGYGDAGVFGQPGTFGGEGSYGGQGTYGQPGTYGGLGTYGGTATQAGYGGGSLGYRSETPLAVRFAEPPLGPSPYAPYSPGDRYAYAASADVGPGPHVLNPYRPGPARCDCGPRREPTIYRYGVGTAY